MNNPIDVELRGVEWDNWNELLDLISEIQARIITAVGQASELELNWTVSPVDEYTIQIQAGYSLPDRRSDPAEPIITLFCKDLENGTTIRLNGEELSHDQYKERITDAFVSEITGAVPA